VYARVPIADENYQSIVSGVLMEIKKIDRRSTELLRHGYTHRVDLDDFDLAALEHMLVSGSGVNNVWNTCSRPSRFVYDTRRCFWECNYRRSRSRSRSYTYSVYFRSEEDVMIFMLSLNQG
jgi:hypothetical protein